MSLSDIEKIYVSVALIDFAGMFICIGIALYFAYTKMDLMLAHLSNCPAVTIRACLVDAGPWGRLHVLGIIMGLMTMPRIYLRYGGASAEDLKNFPTDLKRKLIILQWAGWIFLLIMCAGGAVAKLDII